MKLIGGILTSFLCLFLSINISYSQSYVVDEVIAIVGDNPIFLSELETNTQAVINQRRAQGSLSTISEREEAFEQLLTRALLATCAVMDSLNKDAMPVEAMVEEQVANMAAKAGGTLALEKEMGKPIYQIKSDMTVDIKKMQLSEIMETHIRRNVKVDYKDVEEFLDGLELDETDMIPTQYTYSQIVKIPPQTDERKYAIRERLLSFRERILEGEITLGALAQLYSLDRSSAIKRGEALLPINGLSPEITEALEGLAPGKVSEIIETDFGYHLAELIEYVEQNGEKYIRFRHILLKPEFTVEESRNVTSLLDSLATEIRLGNTTFAEAALQYSDDKKTKQNGGRVFNLNGYYHSGDISNASSKWMAEELPVDGRYIERLKIGEISDPYETQDEKANSVQKIIRLDKITPAHKVNLVDDYDIIATQAIIDKQNRVISEWVADNISRVYVSIKPEYLEYNTMVKGWKEAAIRSQNFQNIDIKLPTQEELQKNWVELTKQRAVRDSIQKAQALLEPIVPESTKKKKNKK